MGILFAVIGVCLYLWISWYVAKQFFAVAEAKGYCNRKYLWICFLLGIAGWILVCALPDCSNPSQNIEDRIGTLYPKNTKELPGRKNAEAAILLANLGDYQGAREHSARLWDSIAVRETVSAGFCHTAGLKSDGSVVAAGDNANGQRNVSSWRNIIAVSAGHDHTVGLKFDGTVVAVGLNKDGQCNVSGWSNIVAISAGQAHTVGLKSDGTVVAVGCNESGACNVSTWTNIVAVSAGQSYTVGLKSDGTVVAAGYNKYGRCDVSSWLDIKSPK